MWSYLFLEKIINTAVTGARVEETDSFRKLKYSLGMNAA